MAPNLGRRALFALMAGGIALVGMGLCAVVINEVELSPSGNASVWVELYNTGDQPVDLTGWTVALRSDPWVGPMSLSGTIAPGDFFVAEGDPRWIPVHNGSAELRDPAGNLADAATGLTDTEVNDFTQARLPDGKDTDTRGDFVFYMGSRGRSNSGGTGRGISI